jgi:hypothetical protein
LIAKWVKAYKIALSKKLTFQGIWKASIKFVCWKIWLASNKLIFKEKKYTPSFIASHALGKIGEFI